MGPKSESVLQFLQCGRVNTIITSGNKLREAAGGLAGIHVAHNAAIRLEELLPDWGDADVPLLREAIERQA